MVATIVTATLEGVVTKANGNGFKLDGRAEWLNVSRFADPAPAMPGEGSHVMVGVDSKGFVRSVDVLDSTAAISTQSVEKPSAEPVGKDRQIIRMNALTNAVAMLATCGAIEDDADVLALAGRLEAWVLR